MFGSPASFSSYSELSSSDSLSSFSLTSSTDGNELRNVRRRSSSAHILEGFEDADDYLALHQEVQILEKIGQGTFGQVFRGIFQGATVAVKILNSTKEDDFLHEIKQTRLRHTCIAGLIAAVAEPPHENEPGYYYIITKYADGGSLADFFKNNSDPEKHTWRWRLAIALDISLGLHFLHTNNMIHRDLKSENVLLSESQRHAMLGDFGLAITKSLNAPALTDIFFGATKYMAPELLEVLVEQNDQDKNEDEAIVELTYPYGFPTDVYALGMLLWELLTHQKPFHELKLTLQLYKQVISENLRPPIPKSTPIHYAKLMQSCWDKQIDKRLPVEQIIPELKMLKKYY